MWYLEHKEIIMQNDWLEVSLQVYPKIFLVDALRYLIPASLTFLLFYVIGRAWFSHRKIQKVPLRPGQVGRELYYSILSALIFGVTGLGVFWLKRSGMTQIYSDIASLGYLYIPFSVVLVLVMHDAYFYWTHRLLHSKYLYRHVHRIHHLSTAPSPWAAYAFHPVEAVIQSLIVPIIVLILPIHPVSIAVFLLIQIIRNVLGHSGFEIFPASFSRSALLRLFQSNTDHDLHHRFTHGNYGLYFTWWDRMLGTDREDSVRVFERVTNPSGIPLGTMDQERAR